MQTPSQAEDTISKLFKAIESGDVNQVRGLIDEDPKLAGARNKDGASASRGQRTTATSPSPTSCWRRGSSRTSSRRPPPG